MPELQAPPCTEADVNAARRCIELMATADKVVPDAADRRAAYEACVAYEVATARAEGASQGRATSEATLRAFIGSVEEMTIGEGVPAGLVVTDDGGKTIRAVPSRVTREWYEAIMRKWHKDEAALVAMYDGYRRDNVALRAALAAKTEASR